MRKENKIVRIRFSMAEKIQDHNCEALASIRSENKLLNAMHKALICLDSEDRIIGNNPRIEHCKKILKEAIEANEFQFRHDDSEREVLDKVIPLFPEYIPSIA